MGERKRGRSVAIKAALAGLVTLGVAGAFVAPTAFGASANGPTPAASSSTGSSAAAAASSAPSGGAATPGAPGSGSMSVAPRVATVAATTWNSAAAAKFWTPARIAAAIPDEAAPAKVGGSGVQAASTTVSHAATTASNTVTSATIAHSYHFGGTPETGIIVYASSNLTTHYCTASVVNSAGRNMILMAAHCNPGSWMAYVPMYQHGALSQPYGIWAVTKVFKDAHYSSGESDASDYDYAFAQVAPNASGQLIQNVTGGYHLAYTSSYYLYITALGYPDISSDPTDEAIRCSPNYRTGKLAGYRQMVLYCTGFYGGTSGGPWVTYFNGTTGNLIGLTGGYEEGGPNSWTSYSPIFDSRIFSLFSYAQTH
ncbi:hypothetical protein ABH940_000374 [Streptacidiphilus sp. BW17]|uniref:hypothetical protein n=1 Tax=Streptacidiphilus sp. BW17 TaxID=3156274 RepID=UPI003513792E